MSRMAPAGQRDSVAKKAKQQRLTRESWRFALLADSRLLVTSLGCLLLALKGNAVTLLNRCCLWTVRGKIDLLVRVTDYGRGIFCTLFTRSCCRVFFGLTARSQGVIGGAVHKTKAWTTSKHRHSDLELSAR